MNLLSLQERAIMLLSIYLVVRECGFRHLQLSMLEVAIASVDAVFDWKAYQDNKGRIRRRSTSAFETISLDDEDEDDDILKEFDKYLHDDEEKKDDNEES